MNVGRKTSEVTGIHIGKYTKNEIGQKSRAIAIGKGYWRKVTCNGCWKQDVQSHGFLDLGKRDLI